MPSDILPSPADLEAPLTPQELDVLQQQYDNERASGHLTIQARFNLAWGLVKCSGPQAKDDISRGVALLMAIYRDEPSRRRECLYYLALGHYQLGNYEEARKFNDMLMDKEPHNMQAQALGGLIQKAVSKEGLVGMALVGSLAAVGAAAAIALIRNRK